MRPSNQPSLGHQQAQSFNSRISFCSNSLHGSVQTWNFNVPSPWAPRSSWDGWESPHPTGVGETKVSPALHPNWGVRKQNPRRYLLPLPRLRPAWGSGLHVAYRRGCFRGSSHQCSSHFTTVGLASRFPIFPDWTLMFKTKHSLYTKFLGTVSAWCSFRNEANQYSSSR